MTKMEHKSIPTGNVEIIDEEEGIVSAIVSVTGVKDRVDDVIEPGAYTKTLKARTPKGVWHHDTTKPVSKTLDIKELMPGDPELPKKLADGSPWPKEAGALKVLTQFNLKGERGRQAYADVLFFGPDQEWCVDEETEILTDRGWLRYDQILTGDRAYVLDPDYATGRFEEIEAVNIFEDKTRRMRLIETGGHSSLTTEAHRWPLVSNKDGGRPEWTTTASLRASDRFFRSAPRADAPQVQKFSDAFVELVGWFWTEGWVPPADHTDAGLYIAQSMKVNPSSVASIRSALDAAFPGEWSEAHSKDDMARFRLRRGSADAVLAVTGADKEPTPEFLASLTRSQLLLLIDTCMAGDGHETKSGQRTWYQLAEAGVRSFEMLCALAGQATNTSPQKDYGNRFGRPPFRVSLLRNGAVGPLASIKTKSYRYKKGKPRTPAADRWVDHTGVVWCPTTPSRTWLARRRGSVYFTGNSIGYRVPSGKAEMKNGVRHILEQDLYEYSPVLFGAMPHARSLVTAADSSERWLSLKSALTTAFELETKADGDSGVEGPLTGLVGDLRSLIDDGLTEEEMGSFWNLVDSINELADEVDDPKEGDPDADPAEDDDPEVEADDDPEVEVDDDPEVEADDGPDDDPEATTLEDELAEIVMDVLDKFGEDDEDDVEELGQALLGAIESFSADGDEEKSIRRFVESMVRRAPDGKFSPKAGGGRAATHRGATGVADGVLASAGWKRSPYAEDFAKENDRIRKAGAAGAVAALGGTLIGGMLGSKYGKQLGVLSSVAGFAALSASGKEGSPIKLSFAVDKKRLAVAFRVETGSDALQRGTREMAETHFAKIIDQVAGGGVTAKGGKGGFTTAAALPRIKGTTFGRKVSEWDAAIRNATRGVYMVKADGDEVDPEDVIGYLAEVAAAFEMILMASEQEAEEKAWGDIDSMLDLHDLAHGVTPEPLDEFKADDSDDDDVDDDLTDDDLDEMIDEFTQRLFGDDLEDDGEEKDFDDWGWADDMEAKRDFKPDLHPRGPDGKFTRKPGSAVARAVNTALRFNQRSNRLLPKKYRMNLAKKRFSRAQKGTWRRERVTAKAQKRQPSRQLARLEAAWIGSMVTHPSERQEYLRSVGITSLNDLHRSVLRDFRKNGASPKIQARVSKNLTTLSDLHFRTEKHLDVELELKLDEEIADWTPEYVFDLMSKMDPEELEELIEGVEELKAAPIAEATGGRVSEPGKGNKGNIRPIIRWFERGEGAARIRWGTSGDFMRCVRLAGKHMTPENAKGFCNKRHVAVLGSPPGQGHPGKKDDGDLEAKGFPCVACGGAVVEDTCEVCLGDWGQKGLRRFIESMVKRSPDGKFSSKGGGKKSWKKKAARAAAVGGVASALLRRRGKKRKPGAPSPASAPGAPGQSAIRHRGEAKSWVDTIDALADMAGDPDSLLNFMVDKGLAKRDRVEFSGSMGATSTEMRGKFDAARVQRGADMARRLNQAAKDRGLPEGRRELGVGTPDIRSIIDLDTSRVRVRDSDRSRAFDLFRSDQKFKNYLDELAEAQGKKDDDLEGIEVG